MSNETIKKLGKKIHEGWPLQNWQRFVSWAKFDNFLQIVYQSTYGFVSGIIWFEDTPYQWKSGYNIIAWFFLNSRREIN